MIESILASRGPDGRGEWTSADAWLLHRRLAVIDPTPGSSQPFVDPPVATVYNGELYNFTDLRSRLSPQPRSVGDTEVYSRWMSDRRDPNDMKGMYAGVTIENDEWRLSRDRFGIKPLYRSAGARPLAAASQVRCFHHIEGAAVSERAVSCFLRFGNVHGVTIFEDVHEVAPGVTETWAGGELVRQEQLEPLHPARDIAGAMRRSMERHLVADVDIAVLLSAGVDSTTLAILAQQAGAHPVAVTVAAVDGRDESTLAAQTARALGLEHAVVEISERDALEAVGPFFDAMDQPSVDGLNTYLVSRAVRSLGIPVALSGLGADELFGGYSSYRRVHTTHMLRWLPPAVLRLLLQRSNANPAKLARWIDERGDPAELATITREIFSPEEVDRLCGTAFQPAFPEGITDPVMSSELWRYMTPTLLRDADAFSMANSVELRVPFLDDEVAAVALGRSAHRRAFEGKRVLSRALRSDLLDEVIARPKTGFELPIGTWLENDLSPFLERALIEGSPLSSHVDVEVARELASTGPWSRRWALVVLNEWLARNS